MTFLRPQEDVHRKAYMNAHIIQILHLYITQAYIADLSEPTLKLKYRNLTIYVPIQSDSDSYVAIFHLLFREQTQHHYNRIVVKD